MADSSSVSILGAGTMGAGIAQLAAQHGWTVFLSDVDQPTAQRGVDGIRSQLDHLVAKGKLAAGAREETMSRIQATATLAECATCTLVIEAIVERVDVKADVLTRAARAMLPDAILATNTSSLSVADIGRALGEGRLAPQLVGMHFFNPAPLMPLVEIVAAHETSPHVARRAAEIAASWGKTVVHCADTPGFIVNRIGRPFYLEAWRIVEQGHASPQQIDTAMKSLAGFRMGPLELTDLIGQDINLGTSTSIWKQLGEPARLAPNDLQRQLVNAGHRGRKTGRGVYTYAQGREPEPAIEIPCTGKLPTDVVNAAREFTASFPNAADGGDVDRYIVARILVGLINEAAWALTGNVATAADIDTAMKLGMNLPRGPLEWARSIGVDTCLAMLSSLNTTVSDNRYAPAPVFASGL